MRSALLRVGFLACFFEPFEAVVAAAVFLAASLSAAAPFFGGVFFPALFVV